jgi:hypothetical protein
MMADKENRQNWSRPELHHWAQSEWRKFVTANDDPELRYWAPGSELPELGYTQHLAKPHKRAAQRLVHAMLLPVLDRRRAGWPEDANPQRISPEVVAELEAVLGPHMAPMVADEENQRSLGRV